MNSNFTFVMSVLNKLDLTKECYKRLRDIYPNVPLVISSGGSNDGTKEWLLETSEKDENLTIFHDDDRLTFSDNYNTAISLVDTEKLVLIHNDMVIGYGFIENLEENLKENMILSYMTIEPPIFNDHQRPGKAIYDFGSGFHDFNYESFNYICDFYVVRKKLHDGATFFMSGYKKTFDDIGGFDGFTFNPLFCEDDDFLIRAKLKGYKLKTTEASVVYHFVSQTSRFGNDYKNDRIKIEISSNRNFVRKWGIPIYAFNELRYWEEDNFNYKIFTMGLTTNNKNSLFNIEPFFDKIQMNDIPEEYIMNEQKNTNFDLRSKFTLTDNVDVMIYETNPLDNNDYDVLQKLRISIPYYETGEYQIGNMMVEIRNKL